MCVPHSYLVPNESEKGIRSQELIYRWLGAAVGVLGTEPGSISKAAITLKH